MRRKQSSAQPQITIFVDGGMVQSVYAKLTGNITVSVVDFDSARAESEHDVKTARRQMKAAQREQREIY